MYLSTNKKILARLADAYSLVAEAVERIERKFIGQRDERSTEHEVRAQFLCIELELKNRGLIGQEAHLLTPLISNAYSDIKLFEIDPVRLYKAVMDRMGTPPASLASPTVPDDDVIKEYIDQLVYYRRYPKPLEYIADYQVKNILKESLEPALDAVKERVLNFKLT